jgi:hypothetical protein
VLHGVANGSASNGLRLDNHTHDVEELIGKFNGRNVPAARASASATRSMSGGAVTSDHTTAARWLRARS